MLAALVYLMGGEDAAAVTYAAWASPTASMTLSNSDRTAQSSTDDYEAAHCVRNDLNTTAGGKFYWEIEVDTLGNDSDIFLGVRRSSDSITSGISPLTGAQYALFRGSGGGLFVSGWTASGGSYAAYAAGDVMMFALDCDTGKFWIGKNGTWFGSGDPAAGTNEFGSGMPAATDFEPFFTTANTPASNVQVTLCTSPGDISYTVPTGFDLLEL